MGKLHKQPDKTELIQGDKHLTAKIVKLQMFQLQRLIFTSTIARFMLWAVLICLLPACQSADESVLRIAASANVQFAMREIVETYSDISGQKTELITGSSGKLTAQITNGAPFQIFLSADQKYPKLLTEVGLTTGEPITYAYGKLVIWTASSTTFDDFSVFTDPQVQYVAMANPETAPYGRASKEFLERINVWDDIKPKLVFGESISQTTQFIETGTANIGLTSYSTVAAGPFLNKGHWIPVPDSLHSPIMQQMVIMAGTEDEVAVARDFVSFLQTAPVKQILRKYGYSIP